MRVPWLFLINLFICLNSFAQRFTTSFNDGWQFLDNADLKSAQPGDWKDVKIPHTWNTDAYRTMDYFRGQRWYKKSFSIPHSLQGKELYIRFDAVNSYAAVYLNGHLLKTHSGGYTAFNVHLPSGLLHEINELTVLADNQSKNIPPLSGDFTIFGGIYRNVWLTALDPAHFDMDNNGSGGVFISTPIVNRTKANVHIHGAITNPAKERLTIIANIYQDKRLISTKRMMTSEAGYWELNDVNINNPRLWSPDTPNLYTVQVQLMQQNLVIDELGLPLGLRWFSADTKNGFMLNGLPLKLMGTNRHQDQYPYGIAVPGRVHVKDITLIKKMGANFIRLAHYPQDEAVLRLCDRLGLIVWEEIPVVDVIADNDTFKQNAKSQLVEMIRQHYNHPSVVFWGYMNEVINQVYYRVAKEDRPAFFKKTVDLAKELEKLLKQEDKSRLSVMACGGSTFNNDIGLSSITDVLGWNLYQGWYGDTFSDFEKYVDTDHAKYPDRPMIISEFGAGSDRRLHSLHPETFDFSIEYQQMFLEHYLPEIMKRKYIIGAAEWNFIDFNVATRQESMPRTNNKGLVYNDRTPKDVYFYFQAFLRKDSAIVHIASRDWAQRDMVTDEENMNIPLKVYSNQKQVRLSVNGRLLETKQTDNCTASWQVRLPAGKSVIRAFAYIRDSLIATDSLILQTKFTPFSTIKTRKEKWDLAINVGSNCSFYDALTDITWQSDQAYAPGSWGYVDGTIFYRSPGRIGTTAEIASTSNTPLLQTMRQDLSAYQIDAPPGTYEIEMHFADLLPVPPADSSSNYTGYNANANAFDVWINDKLFWSGFSPYFLSNNKVNNAIHRKLIYTNTMNHIRIEFKKKNGHTFLNALRVKQL
jgi:beta-galactosidase